MVDWNAIKTEYITTRASYRQLAEKYGVSRVQIGNKGKKENWVELRRQHLDKRLAKTLDADAKKTAVRMTRIQNATDKLLTKIEKAITELDLQFCKEVTREKTIEYNNHLRPDKPTKEVTQETEKVVAVTTIIDRQGLMQIANALRGIKEVQMLKTELDRQEQEARIANLRNMAEKDDRKNEPIQVSLAEELEDYSG